MDDAFQLTVTLEEFEHFRDTLALDETLPPSASLRSPRTAPIQALLERTVAADTINDGTLSLHETIGEGGMGIIRGATQHTLRREVAVKTLKSARRGDERSRAELLHEALVTGGLEHPNVVPVYALNSTSTGDPVIVMKRIEGVSWEKCILHPELAPDRRADLLGWHLEIFEEVCRAVHFAHSHGVLHRDIKPENVMIGSFGEVVLLDWGLAVTTDPARDYLLHCSQARTLSGTPAYMSPEQASADADVYSARTDVYLLGASLFHALNGRPPHEGESVYATLLEAYRSARFEFGAQVPEELRAICRKAMARDPRERYASAEHLRQAILGFQEHRASISLADEATQRLQRLRGLVADEGDETQIRSVFGECRFGFEQALRIWPENGDAHEGRETTIATMLRYEVQHRHLRAAEHLLDELRDRAALAPLVAGLREELEAERAELERLKELDAEGRLSTGAGYRTIGAILGVVMLTVMPLASGQMQSGDGRMTASFLVAGIGECVVLLAILLIFRKGLFANEINRRMAKLIAAFALSLPLFRYVAFNIGFSIADTLAAEAAAYSMGYAALALLSGFSPWLGFAAYAANAILGVHHPEHIYELTAGANFLAIGYLALVWRRHAKA